ncbi:unnamed protein product [Paramecium pentaurelia]|uniref:Alpha-type protein kinase domain-containing protein n=1 Tax=Paramecium pentaurelia TaxID=43138 RepID=A0A8S1S144_9CILI|nr:unnamed protein product [Paramecium pentaurelia]
MSQDQVIRFLSLNGNPMEIKIQNNDKIFYRSISKQFAQNCPEEFIAVYDIKQNKLISKFLDKLESNTTYKLFNMGQAVILLQTKEQLIEQLNGDNEKFKKENTKLKDEINDIKSKSAQEIIKIQQENKNQYETKINELNQKIKEIEPKLLEAQNKIKDQQKDLESARYDLQNVNSKQEVWKKEFEKQLQQKSTENQELTTQCMKQVNEIQNLMKSSMQEKQNFFSLQENFIAQYSQVTTTLDKWQQYAGQLEYEKKQIEQGQQDLGRQIQDYEREVKRLKNRFDQLDTNSKEEIQSLLQDKEKLESQITKLKKDLRESESKQQEELKNQKLKIDSQSQEILDLQLQIQQATQKLTTQINKNKQMTEELEKVGQAQQNGQVKAEEIQKLQKQIQQEQVQNEKLTEEKEGLENKIKDLQRNLNNCQNLNSDLTYKVNDLEKQLKTIQDELKQDLNKKQEKIEKLNIEISQLLKAKEEEFKELINKQEEDNKQSQKKLENSENEISRLKEELTKVLNDKKVIEEEAVKQRQSLLKQISDCDTIIFKKDQELVAIQNLAIVPTYQFRIQRLVEQVPREYFKDIEFAIESMMLDKVNPETFLKDNQAKCQQLDFKLSHVLLHKPKAEATLYNISDQDYRQCVTINNIGDITGIQCFVPVNSSDQSLDRYFLFKCVKCPSKKQLEGKIFGIKQCKKQDNEELETRETAIDNCLSTVIAQDFMKKFTQELNEKNIKNEFDFQFRDQYIIETKKDFKQYLSEQIKGQQLVLQNEGIKNYVEFIEALSGEQSNEFYDYTREYQLDKKQPKDGNIMLSFLEVHKEKKLLDIYNKFKPENIRKELNHFIDYIGGNLKEMPQKLFYAIQQIEIQPDFQKYNGGHMKFDTSPQGKFLSAFTYYSIIKSQRQLCISHLQGVKNQLYDPLVSTYDGFLDKLDQGFNEIRTVESKFLSEPNVNKGIEYLKGLGIKWS